MPLQPFDCLDAIRQQGDLQSAARSLATSPQAIRAQLAVLEREYGQALLTDLHDTARLTPAGRMLSDWGGRLSEEKKLLHKTFTTARQTRILAPLTHRRSVSPKRLKAPGPSPDEIEGMITVALCAPDHGGLCPWRVIGFPEKERATLARLFEDEKRRRDPLASASDLERAHEHATRSPMLLAFVVSPQIREAVPVREQWLAAGAALGNFMNAAHQLGYGAIVLSGERCHDPALCSALGILPTEFLAGFISLGSIAKAPPERKLPDPRKRLSLWTHETSSALAP